MKIRTLVIAALLAGLGCFQSQPSHAQNQKELRIGVIVATTGFAAQVGKDMVDGLNMYLQEVNSDFAGTKVKAIIEDTGGRPDTAVAKARKLILSDKVHLLLGGVLATEGTALAPVSTSEKIVYIASVPAADDLTQRDAAKYPFMVRTGWSSSQPHHALGQYACDLGYKKVAAIGYDFAFGHEAVGGFQKVFEDCGGKVIQKLWPQFGARDFGPFLPALKADADALFALISGASVMQFPKQVRQSGWKKPIIGGGTNYDEFALPAMGDEVIGDISALHYSAALETPRNEAFVRQARKLYGKQPSYFIETMYTSAELIHQVLKNTGGEWPGAEAFVAQISALKIEAVRGPLSFDEFRNPVQNVYIKKVEKRRMFGHDKDELWNTVVKTYPNVSQFWTYDKNQFLKQPVYSREYPPCKNC